MVTTIGVGQLPAQVNAAVAMLDFIDNYIMVVTTYISLTIEFSGLLHCVYLVQYGFAYFLTPTTTTKVNYGSYEEDEEEDKPHNDDDDDDEPPQETASVLLPRIFWWGRVIFSLTVLGFALA